jgi:geranylgeranylglyceryl phosphate synthase family protein
MSALGAPFDRPGVHMLIDPDKWTDDDLRGVVGNVRTPVRSIILGGTYLHSGRMAQAAGICRAAGLPMGSFVGVGPLDSYLVEGTQFALVPVLLGARSTQLVTDHLFWIVEPAARLGVDLRCIGYVPIDGGVATAAAFFAQYVAVPHERPEILSVLASVAAALGLRGLYLDAGSGAAHPVTRREIAAARANFAGTVIVGGGVRDAAAVTAALEAGADAVVVGTQLERSRSMVWLPDGDMGSASQ